MNRVNRVLCCLGIFFFTINNAWAQQCKPVAAFQSVLGTVQWRQDGNADWQTVNNKQELCAGTTVRTLENSRADISLSNRTLIRLKARSTLTLSDIKPKQSSFVELLQGVMHIFSRTPSEFKVNTPYVNAAIEGTEFVVDVQDQLLQTIVLVYEGRVIAKNEFGELSLKPGESAIAKKGEAPRPYIVVKPRDGVAWTLYFPPVIDYHGADLRDDGAWRQALKSAIAVYQNGDISAAFAALQGQEESNPEAGFFLFRASLNLTVGQVEAARDDIEKVLADTPRQSSALALKTIIHVVLDDKDAALNTAKQAVNQDKNDSAAWIALSYAHQARFDLDQALKDVQQAVNVAPKSAQVRARLAEMWLAHGELGKALKAAKEAEKLNPSLARIQTVLGFAYLTQFKTKKAKKAFSSAVEKNTADPLPYLGMGLAWIKEGQLNKGREFLEVAVSFDPGNSLLRSYLGKAYVDNNMNKFAGSQFQLAKKLDRFDPTPYLYNAIFLELTNEPVLAWEEYSKSLELNENRANFRSKFLLDKDYAVKEVNIARIYRDIGMDRLAKIQGWDALNLDPTSPSAHRLIADSYVNLPRHDVARISHLFQANLNQKLISGPVQPQLAEFDLGTFSDAGISSSSLNEYNALFLKNGIAANGNFMLGNNRTQAAQVSVAGVNGNSSVSVGQYHYQTNGYRENSDLFQDIYNVLVKTNPLESVSLLFEFRDKEKSTGDLPQRIDPKDFQADKRIDSHSDIYRMGGVIDVSSSSKILAHVSSEKNKIANDQPSLFIQNTSRRDADSVEAQYLYNSENYFITSGAGYFDIEELIEISSPFFALPPNRFFDRHKYGYFYFNYRFSRILLTLGADYNELDYESTKKIKKSSPKLGLAWKLSDYSGFRLTYSKNIKKKLINASTIEPTELAGFNQFYDDLGGTIASQYSIGYDQRFGRKAFVGFSLTRRDMEVPIFLISNTVVEKWEEHVVNAYAATVLTKNFSVNLNYIYDDFDQPQELVNKPFDITSHVVPIDFRFNSGRLTLSLATSYLDQKVYTNTTMQGDSFVLTDMYLTYQFSKNTHIRLDVKNVFDEYAAYQEIETPRVNENVSTSIWPVTTILLTAIFNF